MRLIKSTIDAKVSRTDLPCLTRNAARAIVIKDEQILLVFTQKYQDYSLPGGGINLDETHIQGLIRELEEETGAQNIINIQEFGRYEEIRLRSKNGYDLIKMLSFCYTCDIDEHRLPLKLEDYEIKNGMRAFWINIDKAIAHNLNTLANAKQHGLSIVRETYLLQLIARELC